MSEENTQLVRIVEGAILAAQEPLNIAKLQSLFETDQAPEKETLEEVLSEIKESCEGRGFELVEVASGWRFQVRESVATWVNRLWEEKPQKYSRALLETLALIAYRQPITRGDIEDVRGVAVSSNIIKTLSERDWVKVVGHRDVPGRPALYATTRIFLDYFNLKSLDELPTLGELKDIDCFKNALDFAEAAEQKPDDEAEMSGENGTTGEVENSELADEGESLDGAGIEESDIEENAGVGGDLENNANDMESEFDADFDVDEAAENLDLEEQGSNEVVEKDSNEVEEQDSNDEIEETSEHADEYSEVQTDDEADPLPSESEPAENETHESDSYERDTSKAPLND